MATNYYNRQAAIKDFNALGKFAANVGCKDLAEKHQPPDQVGWKTIDKHLGKLRDELRAKGFEPPPNPSRGESA